VEQLTLVQLALLCQGTNYCVGFTLYTDQTQGYLKVWQQARHSLVVHACTDCLLHCAVLPLVRYYRTEQPVRHLHDSQLPRLFRRL
jgi:hypothetical protein